MKKTIILLVTVITIIIILGIWNMFYNSNFHSLYIFNKSNKPIDSIIIFTDKKISLLNSKLITNAEKKFEINLSNYKLNGKEGFFFIKIYQGNFYLTRPFNYHDNWKMLKKSDIYVYKDFISLTELNANSINIENINITKKIKFK